LLDTTTALSSTFVDANQRRTPFQRPQKLISLGQAKALAEMQIFHYFSQNETTLESQRRFGKQKRFAIPVL
jgi:hypothetical protein